MSLSLSILGCGWLGLPLASRCILDGFIVKGSTTQADKGLVLAKQGIKPYVMSADTTSLTGVVEGFFDSDILVITLPFKRQLINPADYYHQIKTIVARAKESVLKPWVIFTSSTAVYPSTGTWAEGDVFQAENPRAQVLLDVEGLILANQGTVVRLGGLYGPAREIHRFFLKASLLKSAQGKMNLIHRDDAIGVITNIIRKQARGEIFNAVSDVHPTRFDLYTHLSKKYNVPLPVFDAAALAVSGKIVSNEKIKAMLEYRFIYPDPHNDA